MFKKSEYITSYTNRNEVLKENGIEILTAESDALGFRLLCDITEQGESTISGLLGGCTLLAKNWNPKAIKSCLLSHTMLEEIFRYIVITKHNYMIEYKNCLYGIDNIPVNKIWKFINAEFPDYKGRLYSNPGFERNLHHFTGRTF